VSNEMSSEQTAVETNTVTDTPEQKNSSGRLLPDTPVDGKGERMGITREKPKYKSIPENWKAIPSGRFRNIIRDIETVLLEISVDGKVTSNPFDWKPTIPTLHVWAGHLRSALKELTK
jgi:hypothetical protein